MASGASAVPLEAVWQMLGSLGYHNPSAEDIALTVQHVGQVPRDAKQTPLCAAGGGHPDESFRHTSTSPPRGVNDVTMAPDPEQDGDDAAAENGNASSAGPPPASSKQWPGLSSRSIRGGRTTPMNSTGTAQQAQRGRGHGNAQHQQQQQFKSKQPYRTAGVVVEGYRERHGKMNNGKSKSNAMPHETVVIPTAHNKISCAQAEYVNPAVRLERHLKRYDRGLKALYVDRYDTARDEFLRRIDRGEEKDDGDVYRNEGDVEDDEEEEEREEYYRELVNHSKDYVWRPYEYYDEQTGRQAGPEMPLRPSRATLNQRSANVIYSFTGDARFKYRGGEGAPLCVVLGANGSTLRQRADPVKRGQQMRELWKNDPFLAQQGRKEDRWRVRQNMLARTS